MILFKQGNAIEAFALFAQAEAQMKPLPREKRGVSQTEPLGTTCNSGSPTKKRTGIIPQKIPDGGWEQAIKHAEGAVEESRKAKGAGAKETSCGVEKAGAKPSTQPDAQTRPCAVLTEASIGAPQDLYLSNESRGAPSLAGKE
jgi:hypothetical protein